MKRRKQHKHSKIIDRAGGTTKVAQLAEVGQSTVSQWRHRGMPHMAEMYLRVMVPEAFEDGG